MIGSPACAVPGAMPARMAAPRAAARWRARMGGATVAPESWRDPPKRRGTACRAAPACGRSARAASRTSRGRPRTRWRGPPARRRSRPVRGATPTATCSRGCGNSSRSRRRPLALRRVVAAPPEGLAGGQGFEPRYPAPKTGVLPLDDPPGRGRYYDAPVTAPTVLILAAGEGTRMRSAVPKMLHPLCGRTMIEWPIAAAREAGAGRIVVVDGPKRALADALPEDVEVAIQEEPNGTGDAVRSAAGHIGADETVLVLYGDVPLITGEAISALTRAHEESGAAATMATMELEDPSGYGRVVRDAQGAVERVVETKTPGDATPEEEAIREVNTGIY